MKILQLPTKLAEWHHLVTEAEKRTGFQLDEAVENYVVITLDAFTTNPDLASTVVAVDFLKNLNIESVRNLEMLRQVGDQCLILSGLFPERVKRKLVSADYFIQIGKRAYHVLSVTRISWKLDRGLFFQLSENFITVTDILQAMRFRSVDITH